MAAPAGAQVRKHGLDGVPGAREVDAQRLVELGGVDALEVVGQRAAGAVDQHVGRAELDDRAPSTAATCAASATSHWRQTTRCPAALRAPRWPARPLPAVRGGARRWRCRRRAPRAVPPRRGRCRSSHREGKRGCDRSTSWPDGRGVNGRVAAHRPPAIASATGVGSGASAPLFGARGPTAARTGMRSAYARGGGRSRVAKPTAKDAKISPRPDGSVCLGEIWRPWRFGLGTGSYPNRTYAVCSQSPCAASSHSSRWPSPSWYRPPHGRRRRVPRHPLQHC